MAFAESLTLFANATDASIAMRSYVTPAVATLCVLASLVCAFFLVNGGVQYMSSTGKPEKLEQAKKIIKNALLGLVLVIGAATLTAILSHAYAATGSGMTEKLPSVIPAVHQSSNLTSVLLDAITGLFRNVIQSIGEPFVKALGYFVSGTPLMAENSSVFNLWLTIVGITDVLFVLVVALLGFHVMSFSTFGFDELDLKQLLPQFALIFLLINTSIFAIDAVIGLSNAMIHALQSGFPGDSVWDILAEITKKSDGLGLAGLLVMIAFLVLTVMLLVYYVGRLITLYLGAILSPLILLLWLIPAFKDFAITALKVYLTTIFVIFVHVVILLLASSIFTGALSGGVQANNLMAMIVGLATLVALLKAQGVMKELSYAASAPRAAREVGSQLIRSIRTVAKPGKSAWKQGKKAYAKSKKAKLVPTVIVSKKSSGSGGSSGSVGGQQTNSAPSKPLKTGETQRAPSPTAKEKSTPSKTTPHIKEDKQ